MRAAWAQFQRQGGLTTVLAIYGNIGLAGFAAQAEGAGRGLQGDGGQPLVLSGDDFETLLPNTVARQLQGHLTLPFQNFQQGRGNPHGFTVHQHRGA